MKKIILALSLMVGLVSSVQAEIKEEPVFVGVKEFNNKLVYTYLYNGPMGNDVKKKARQFLIEELCFSESTRYVANTSDLVFIYNRVSNGDMIQINLKKGFCNK
jgi:opacity protein-like surface antigen